MGSSKIKRDPEKDDIFYVEMKLNEFRGMLRRGGLNSLEEDYVKKQIDGCKSRLRVLQGRMKWSVN